MPPPEGGPSGDVAARLGVIGGTFDPPHYAHLVLAENARVQLSLDRVLFVPAGSPPHKPERPITSVHHRVAMVRAAIANNRVFVPSLVDVEREGPHYTVDTLTILRKRYSRADFYFLIGGDSLAEFDTWRHPAEILELTRLAVMQRPGWETDVEELSETLPGVRDRLAWLDAPSLEISGTDLRRRVARGLPIRYLVPDGVEQYVRAHGLYET